MAVVLVYVSFKPSPKKGPLKQRRPPVCKPWTPMPSLGKAFPMTSEPLVGKQVATGPAEVGFDCFRLGLIEGY